MSDNACGDQITPSEAKYGPSPGKHANRKYSLLYNGQEGQRSMRRSQFLFDGDAVTTKGHVTAGYLQSGQVLEAPQPYSLTDESNYPQTFLGASRLLQVPKVVIFSLLPQWSIMWDICTMIYPSDIVRTNPATGDSNNYSYMEQYNGRMSQDPGLRNYQNIGELVNTWWSGWQTMRLLLGDLAAALLDGPDPIYLCVPDWFPANFGASKTNDNLPHKWTRSGLQDSPFQDMVAPNFCFNQTPVNDPFNYPDRNARANMSSYASGGVPCMASNYPFFGCNVLHLYIGHFAMKQGVSTSTFDWESWPTSPEGSWLGHVWNGKYLGGLSLPFFNGWRELWTIAPTGYGYPSGSSGSDTYFNAPGYRSACRGAAAAFKSNYYEYRNFETRLIPMPGTVIEALHPENIWQDRLPCKGYGFWFGFDTLQDFINAIGATGSQDLFFTDITGEDGLSLKEYMSTGYSPSVATLNDALSNWAPLIRQNILQYYGSITPGTVDFWKAMMDDNCLADFGFQNNTVDGSIFQATSSAVEYIQGHFAQFPS